MKRDRIKSRIMSTQTGTGNILRNTSGQYALTKDSYCPQLLHMSGAGTKIVNLLVINERFLCKRNGESHPRC